MLFEITTNLVFEIAVWSLMKFQKDLKKIFDHINTLEYVNLVFAIVSQGLM